MRDNLVMAHPMDRTGLEGALAALGDVLAYRGEAYEIVLVGAGTSYFAGSSRGLPRMPTSWASA